MQPKRKNISKLLFSFFLFLFFISSSTSFKDTSKCSTHQRHALLLFKQNLSSTNYSNDYYDVMCAHWLGSRYHPIMMNWNTGSDCCKWDGVTCNPFTGDVIGLDLSCGMLRGTIHPNTTLFHLPHLQRLNLAFNNFTNSQLPHGISRLSNSLTHLNISHSGFTSHIPTEISFLSKLVSLDLSLEWSGDLKIQPFVFHNLLRNCTLLSELSLANINISIPLPTYFNLTSLKLLDLRLTGLRGKLPVNILSLPQLEKLVLLGNPDITGPLPEVNRSTSIPLKLLDLSFKNLSISEMPDSIGHLMFLNYLDLSSCGLMGPLPKSLVYLTQLITLDLSDNMLNGTLPSFLFTSLPLLQRIDLSRNKFSGRLPSELFNSRSLKEIILYNNHLDGEINVQGPTSPSFIQLISLTTLYLSSNNFTGVCDLDTLLSTLPNLQRLDLSNSGLSVVTNNATNYGNPHVQYLLLSSCKLTVFPESIQAMKNIHSLDLSFNDIHGPIPDWAGEIGGNELFYLDLSHNFITGLPRFQYHRLQYLYVQSNMIQGPFPPSICNMSELTDLNISSNSFGGVIPQCFGNMRSFPRMVDLRNNYFHGTIPNWGENLEGLVLNGNQLEGEVPRSLSECRLLKVLDLGNNHLNGTFPTWLEDLPQLHVLILKSNNFHGTIETTSTIEFPFPLLRVLDLSQNGFVGQLPQKYFQNFNAMKNVVNSGKEPIYLELGGSQEDYSLIASVKGLQLSFQKLLVDFTIVDLSNNKFEGEIPNIICGLHSLKVLNLSHNKLSGRIPHALGDLSKIESLDLSSNHLIGEIPQSLADITSLEVLNLSQNHLTGCIPIGKQLSTFGENSYGGNLGLCGFPLPYCLYSNSSQVLADREEEESGFTWKAVMLGFGCGTLLGLMLGCLMLSTGRPKWFNAIADVGEHMINTRRNKRIHIYIGR